MKEYAARSVLLLDPTLMKPDANARPVVVPVRDKLPHEGNRVIVITKRFRCLGYVDAKGIWRDDASHEKLPDVVAWMEV